MCGAYVEDILGAEFMIPPPWTLNDVFPATSPRAPTIFILSPGADLTAELQRFAEANGRVAGEKSLVYMSPCLNAAAHTLSRFFANAIC